MNGTGRSSGEGRCYSFGFWFVCVGGAVDQELRFGAFKLKVVRSVGQLRILGKCSVETQI